MQLYEFVTHMTTFGLTFDEAVCWMVYLLLGVIGGSAFMFGLACDIARVLYRAVRRLLRAVLRPIRRRLKMHFQK